MTFKGSMILSGRHLQLCIGGTRMIKPRGSDKERHEVGILKGGGGDAKQEVWIWERVYLLHCTRAWEAAASRPEGDSRSKHDARRAPCQTRVKSRQISSNLVKCSSNARQMLVKCSSTFVTVFPDPLSNFVNAVNASNPAAFPGPWAIRKRPKPPGRA